MSNFDQHQFKKSLDKKTLSIVHLLYPYVKQRIRVAETLGIFPRNMYKASEVIDEVILELYENELQQSLEPDQLRLWMFEKTFERLNALMQSEEWHKDTISTKLILEKELKRLEENFTAEADNDLVMNEDLDDISYHDEKDREEDLPYDDQEEGVRSFLGLEEDKIDDWKERPRLKRLYYRLPPNTSNIIDLYLLGKLSFSEIAKIVKTEMAEVKQIIKYVREMIRKQLE